MLMVGVWSVEVGGFTVKPSLAWCAAAQTRESAVGIESTVVVQWTCMHAILLATTRINCSGSRLLPLRAGVPGTPTRGGHAMLPPPLCGSPGYDVAWVPVSQHLAKRCQISVVAVPDLRGGGPVAVPLRCFSCIIMAAHSTNRYSAEQPTLHRCNPAAICSELRAHRARVRSLPSVRSLVGGDVSVALSI